ncbi:DUF4267 domain-containing protein [Kitasatospora cheerisanensis]|uniref:Small membrane hydrophobic protein n=1 Tax=Kitasatospora cheerisanensis KCTC 2395 TaxID=1348663 RepID=A0A066Z8V4_9ACTN|nr:DUF4267 domain-containing protein [Kitasatospora cheerisanensis]KDN86610.1 hypothetical protein KCH_17060 [Kitasatospora cheerisanensis KCTC 2395]
MSVAVEAPAVEAPAATTTRRLRIHLATAGTVLLGLFPLWFGLSYVLAPESTAPSFGLPAWPHGDAATFLITKGIRDVVSGLVPLALLLLGHRRASGWAMLVIAAVPVGDATTILVHHGSTAMAFGVHYATAAVMVLVAGLVLTEKPASRS